MQLNKDYVGGGITGWMPGCGPVDDGKDEMAISFIKEEILYLIKRLTKVTKDTGMYMEICLTITKEQFKELELDGFEKTDITISNYDLCGGNLGICIEKENWLYDEIVNIGNNP